MASSIRTILPYKSVAESDLCRIQGYIPIDTKRRIIGAMGGDDSVLSLIVQTAFQKVNDHIVANSLLAYSSEQSARIVDFIRHGSNTCAAVNPPAHPLPSGGAGGEPASASTSLPARTPDEPSREGDRAEGKVKEKRLVKIKLASRRASNSE